MRSNLSTARRASTLLFGAFAFVTGEHVAIGATLYVDGTIASSSCTTYDPATRACGSGAATAYQRIEDTFPVAIGGDVVAMRAGTYTAAERVGPANSGSALAPITFRAFGDEAVHVRGTHDPRGEASTTSSPFDLSGRAFIDLEGFEISHHGLCIRLDGATDIGIRRMNLHDCGHGIWITNHSARVDIRDLVSSRNSFRDGGASVSISGASTDIHVERASATTNIGDTNVGAVEGDGFHTDDDGNARITFIDCVATDNEDDGFDITATDVRIERCIAARNIVGFKLWDEHCSPSDCPNATALNHFTLMNVQSWANRETGLFAQNGPEIEVYNSVFAGNMYEGVRMAQNRDVFADPVARAVMQNNLFLSNGSWGRRFDAAGADNTDWVLTSDHNVFFENGNGNAVWSAEDASTLTSDPQCVAPASGDFHLRASSPAIDSGRDLSTVFATDFDGASRPAGAGWDRGPYEFGATTALDGGSADAATDAMAMTDASKRADASVDARPDVSLDDARDDGPDTTGSGCGCRTERPAGGSSFAGWLLVLAGVATPRRKDRRTLRRDAA